MDRFAAFIDVGSLVASLALHTVGTPTRRDIELDGSGLAREVVAWCRESVDLPLLRVYWYDGDLPVARTTNRRIGELDDIHLRLGPIVQKQQKGVDALLYVDLLGLAASRGIATALIVATDGDFVEPIRQAQQQGVRVEIGAFGTSVVGKSLSPRLAAQSDRIVTLDVARFARFVRRASNTAPAAVSPPIRSVPNDVAVAPVNGGALAAVADEVGAALGPMGRAGAPSGEPAVVDPADPAAILALGERMGREARAARSYVDALEVLNGFPVIPKGDNGRLMTAASRFTGRHIPDDIAKDVRAAWRRAFKQEHRADAAPAADSAPVPET